ncbi:ferredoxin [Mycolicibacterium fluoranthenivorans]|jgi:ferredoxin|uniref:Ferredoxin n=1 Tax=Mycolicibacterium fluoranthenivorans TaxID=258505 RepID=A0A1G4WFS8_9MYCO|nr:ferredoxin [Mycolicibacterium fluoranthenivorans]QNJ94123.1 ferredoxin [Mycolicibacterium fluoranthenivorans]SCX22161.1 ferredoxin [Mycolicibacterium fluoranthenivorans]
MQPLSTEASTGAHRRLRIDPKLCEAHALCIDLDPEIFDLGDDVATCTPEIGQSHWDSAEAAIAACPRQAISWIVSS